MNNATEYTDETKPIQVEDLKKLNQTGGSDPKSGTSAPLDKSKSQGDGSVGGKILLEEGPQVPDAFDVFDLLSRGGLQTNGKYFERLQDFSDLCLNKLRVPYCSDNFRRLRVPKSRAGVPVIPYDTFITEGSLTGGGSTFFMSWFNSTEEAHFLDFIDEQANLTVKMDAKTKAKLMTLASIWSNEYLDKGVRDSRARPSAILGDWGWALPPTFSMTTRNIRTDLVATWMYGSYTPTSPVSKCIVINASDLRTFMNTTGGNYWPVEQTTPCVALGQMSTSVLAKLAIFGFSVLIDFDSSMANRSLTLTSWNGCPAYEVPLNSNVTTNDFDVAKILNNTFSSVDLQWAVFANTLPLNNKVDALITTGGGSYFDFNLKIYSNSIADQFINFYATHRNPNGNSLPTNATRLVEFVQAWRMFKTMATSRCCIELGSIGPLANSNTYGKEITCQNFFDSWSCCFEFIANNNNYNGTFRPLWIPYEMWIENGADIQLDSESYVDGESPYVTNTIYLCPRSQVLWTLSQWQTPNVNNPGSAYYRPNSASSTMTVANNVTNVTSCCLPCTVPRYDSTCETATLPWVKDQTIDFVYTNTGKNSNSIFRKKMVFTSATKN